MDGDYSSTPMKKMNRYIYMFKKQIWKGNFG